MIAALIALYGAGMMMMVLLIHAAKQGKVRKRIALFSIFFWPFFLLAAMYVATHQIISEEWKGK
jgi:hypothetical protein